MAAPKTSIDLDALAAAQAAGNGRAPTFTFRGQSFTLTKDFPVLELPAAMAAFDEASAAQEAGEQGAALGLKALGALNNFMGLMFDDPEEYARFRALKPGIQELMTLALAIPQLYQWSGLGESGASPGSSRGTGNRSKRTSKPTTR
jgi:hypothetical protein